MDIASLLAYKNSLPSSNHLEEHGKNWINKIKRQAVIFRHGLTSVNYPNKGTVPANSNFNKTKTQILIQ